MKIENRIAQLRKYAIEDGGKINESSVKDFTNFIALVGDEQLSISLTPENNIYASFLLGIYSFHFKGDGDISFVTIKDDDR